MATAPISRKLNLTRDQLAAFLTDQQQIRQFEKDFAESQSIGALASTETLQSQVNLIRTASVVPAPVLPPRLPAGVERPSGSRETTA